MYLIITCNKIIESRHLSLSNMVSKTPSGKGPLQAKRLGLRHRKTFKWWSMATDAQRVPSCYTRQLGVPGPWQIAWVCKVFELLSAVHKQMWKSKIWITSQLIYRSILTHTSSLCSEYTIKHTQTNSICMCAMLELQLRLPLGVNGPAPKHHVLLRQRAALST